MDEWAAGWGTLALINAGLAQSKGRAGLNWFVGSLVLGPLATLLIVAMDRPEARPAASTPDGPSPEEKPRAGD